MKEDGTVDRTLERGRLIRLDGLRWIITQELTPALETSGCTWTYREIDPDLAV